MKKGLLFWILNLVVLILSSNFSTYAQDTRQNLIERILKPDARQETLAEAKLKSNSLLFLPLKKNQVLLFFANNRLANSLGSGSPIKKSAENEYVGQSQQSIDLVKLTQLRKNQIAVTNAPEKVGKLIFIEDSNQKFIAIRANKSAQGDLYVDQLFKIQKAKNNIVNELGVAIAKSDYQRKNGAAFKTFQTLMKFYKYLFKTTEAAFDLSVIISSSTFGEKDQNFAINKSLADYAKSVQRLTEFAKKLGALIEDELTLLNLLTQASTNEIPEKEVLIQRLEAQLSDRALGSYQKKVAAGASSSIGDESVSDSTKDNLGNQNAKTEPCTTCENTKMICPKSMSCVNKPNPYGSACPVTPKCECTYANENPVWIRSACEKHEQGPCGDDEECGGLSYDLITGCLVPECDLLHSCRFLADRCARKCKTCKKINNKPECVDFNPPFRMNDQYPDFSNHLCTRCPLNQKDCAGTKNSSLMQKSVCCSIDSTCGVEKGTGKVTCCPSEGCCPELREKCAPWEAEEMVTKNGCKIRTCKARCSKYMQYCELAGKGLNRGICCSAKESCGFVKDGGFYPNRCCPAIKDCPKGTKKLYDKQDENGCFTPVCQASCEERERVCPKGKTNGDDGVTCCPRDNTCGYNENTKQDVCCPPIAKCPKGFHGYRVSENGCERMICKPPTTPTPTPTPTPMPNSSASPKATESPSLISTSKSFSP